jgi:hypothetical protein
MKLKYISQRLPKDYRCDNRRFWLSAHNCQVPTPISQNLEIEQQIWILKQTNSPIAWKIEITIHNPQIYLPKMHDSFFEFADEQVLEEG